MLQYIELHFQDHLFLKILQSNRKKKERKSASISVFFFSANKNIKKKQKKKKFSLLLFEGKFYLKSGVCCGTHLHCNAVAFAENEKEKQCNPI